MAVSVSNPTTGTGRVQAKTLLQGRYCFLRQDLAYLREIAGTTGARRPLANAPKPAQEMVKRIVGERNVLIVRELPRSCVVEAEYPLPKHPDGAVPLCNLRVDGLPIRPDKVKCSGNAVQLMRRFGSLPGYPPMGPEIESLLTEFGPDQVEEAVKKVVYTPGTFDGFVNRLKMITCPGVRSIYRVIGTHHDTQMKHLERLLPVEIGKLPDWMGHDGDLISLLTDVKLTGRASAGAPYWRKKSDSIDHIFYVVELIATAIKEGTLDKLLKEQPELFLIECKNKTDRYEFSKLKDKTRPYFNPPAHWSILASFLFQGLSMALHRVGGEKPTTNAYGWSAAGGGIDKLVEDVRRRFHQGERGWCYVYGDDGDLYFSTGGNLYRVSPDVRQMDSCVDFDTITVTLEYVKHVFTQAHGESRMWNMIIDALLAFMKQPRIMVSGSTLYTKEPDGLLSGIVGTTMYDTVKASVSYTDLLEKHAANPARLLDEGYVARYLKEHYGLNLKEGTWQPEIVNLDPTPASFDNQGNLVDPEEALFGVGKFLGTNYVRVQGPKRPQWIPWLPEEDWLSCLVAPREEEMDTRQSHTARSRTQWDRIRGYLTTGAAFSPRIRRALHYWIDLIPAEVILMQPQGTEPPEGLLFGAEVDWDYPSPEFLPHWQWVFDIYASPDNKFNAPEQPLFNETVMNLVTEARLKKRKVNLRLVDGVVEVVPFAPKAPLPIGVEMDVVTQQAPPRLDSHWKSTPPVRAVEHPPAIPIPGLPLDLAYVQTAEQAVAAALNNPPPPAYRNVTDDLLLFEEAQSMIVDQPPPKIPQVELARPALGPSLVHPPTPGGVLGFRVELNSTLLRDDLTPKLKKFIDVGVEASPNAAVNRILSRNGIQARVKSRDVVHDKGKSIVLACVEAVSFTTIVEEFVTKTGLVKRSIVKKTQPKILMEWEGDSLKSIKESFAIVIIEANKKNAAPILDSIQEQDWAAAASPQVAPYSLVADDPRPAPPPELLLPLCPATIPVEKADGSLVIANPSLAPPVPPRGGPPPRPKASKAQLLARLSRMEVRQGRRIYVRGSDTEDSDEEVYENAYSFGLLQDEKSSEKSLPKYLGIAEVDEMLRCVGRLNSSESPLKLKPSDRYTINNLKKLLDIVTRKTIKKNDKEKAKQTPSASDSPAVPPRKTKTPPKAEAKEVRNEGRSGSSPANRRRGKRGAGKRDTRTGNRSPVEPEGGSQ